MPFEINCCIGDETRELLAALTLRVRAFSSFQIARTWPKAIASLKRLESHGLLFSFVAVAHSMDSKSAALVHRTADVRERCLGTRLARHVRPLRASSSGEET